MNSEGIEYQCSGCKATVPADAKVCPNCGARLDEATASTSDKEALGKLAAVVIHEIKKGTDDFSIAQKLVEMGMDKNNAPHFVEQIHMQAIKVAEEQQITVESYTPALTGAVLASIVGGIIWGLIVIATNYVIGYMAWGMGWLAGFAVVTLSKGKKGLPFQVIAVLSSLLGIVVGKYIIFYHFLKQDVVKEYGAEAASNVAILSGKVMQIFIDDIGSTLSGYDLLWVALAVMTAWKIPKGLGIKART